MKGFRKFRQTYYLSHPVSEKRIFVNSDSEIFGFMMNLII